MSAVRQLSKKWHSRWAEISNFAESQTIIGGRMTKKMLAAVLFGLVGVAMPVFAQMSSEVDLERTYLKAEKRSIIAENLTLTPDQSEAFWKVYGDYEKDMYAVATKGLSLIADFALNYETLTDAKSDELVKNYLSYKAEVLKVRKKYFSKFRKVLPGTVVARFYQIENKLEALINAGLAGQIPLVE